MKCSNKMEKSGGGSRRCRAFAAWKIGGEPFCQAHAGIKALSIMKKRHDAEKIR